MISYKNSAEYIKINNKGSPDDETIIRRQLWNYEQPKFTFPGVRKRSNTAVDSSVGGLVSLDDGVEAPEAEEEEKVEQPSNKVQRMNEAALVSTGQQMIRDKLVKRKDDITNTFACPVFDEFLQAFIVTHNDQSFYMDLSGNYDFNFKKIQWGNKVVRIQIASPYLVGYL